MTEDEFVERVLMLARGSNASEDDRELMSVWIAVCCDTTAHKRKIEGFLQEEGATLETVYEKACAMFPPLEIVDDE